jgi:tetratricopeptide (TPR) repeat protein
MGDTTFELYYTGGMHTASDIAIFVPERGLLLTGDTMADVWLNDTPGCLAAFMARPGVRHDFPLLLENWGMLLAKKGQIKDIIPGHWNGDVSVAGFEARYEYVKTLWDGIQAAAAQGKGLDEVLVEYRLATRFPALVGSPGFNPQLNAASITEIWSVVTKQESAAAKLYTLIDEGEGEDAVRQVVVERDAKQPRYFFLEGEINAQGYRFLQDNKTAQAIVLFKLNVELFPEAWNVYDSLGEALLKSGDTAGATSMYEKSLALNPESKSGKDALANLRGPAQASSPR